MVSWRPVPPVAQLPAKRCSFWRWLRLVTIATSLTRANHASHGGAWVSMNTGLIARASATIAAPAADVWEALVTPPAIKMYMFDATVTSDWVVGSPIVWIGEWQGRPFEDKGIILQIIREHVLEFSYFSPRAGVADLPENYHVVTVH